MTIKISDESFQRRVDKSLTNHFMRDAVATAQKRLKTVKKREEEALGDWEALRTLAKEIRDHTINQLDYYLHQLATEVEKRGGNVFFAQTAEQANDYIKKVAKKKQARKIVKSKSMVTEEIGLNSALQAIGCEVIETDLGEYILQLDDDPPSHIVAPALHKNKQQICETFQQKKNYQQSAKPEQLTSFVRQLLRKEFLQGDIGITGCNFAVAASGSIVLVTNEGNARMVTTLPKTQITVMGMERIVPTWEELDIMVSLLCRSAVGQKLTSYVTAITGPRDHGEIDGPEEFHLVILDNGRSNILNTEFQSVLNCIRCAACINVCPVYRHIGGHAYGAIYPGPIGAVLAPLLHGYDDFQELPYASSLCAACTDACPVKIPLHDLLLKHRQRMVAEKRVSSMEKLTMTTFGSTGANPKLFSTSTKLASLLARPFINEDKISSAPRPLKRWTETRDLPAPQRTTFLDWYKKIEVKGQTNNGDR